MKILLKSMAVCAIGWSLAACQDQEFADRNTEVARVNVKSLDDYPDLAVVRDYVVPDAVIAHRGSTYWTPEETEAAYRWAREIGADYLELDLQCSKDGVLLALHDDNLKRTTNIEEVYGEFMPAGRKDYYKRIGLDSAETEAQMAEDLAYFQPFYAASYTFEELAVLDAGRWFNIKPEVGYPEQIRPAFETQQQYISTLRDVIMIAQGYKLKRNASGQRDTVRVVPNSKGAKDLDRGMFDGVVSYRAKYYFDTAYVQDDKGDKWENDVWKGNTPGVYPEFKESWLNPNNMEQLVYDELDSLGWNVATDPVTETAFYTTDGKVNVGNTNGKVVLQTFAISSLAKVSHVFGGKVPMCFLLWPNSGSLLSGTPSEYASSINLAIANKAHIIGPCIAGAPNNYPEANADWQAYLIHKAGMLNHPYSFDTREQMYKYYGVWDNGAVTEYNYVENGKRRRYIDAMFTNHADATLKFYLEQGKTKFKGTESAVEVLERLGY